MIRPLWSSATNDIEGQVMAWYMSSNDVNIIDVFLE
jgi:hypothetical protein